MEYGYENITVKSKIKIICQLYVPRIVDNKIIFYQEPIGVHKRFITENYYELLNYIKKQEEKEIIKNEQCYANG